MIETAKIRLQNVYDVEKSGLEGYYYRAVGHIQKVYTLAQEDVMKDTDTLAQTLCSFLAQTQECHRYLWFPLLLSITHSNRPKVLPSC
jgi:hypothetical protein